MEWHPAPNRLYRSSCCSCATKNHDAFEWRLECTPRPARASPLMIKGLRACVRKRLIVRSVSHEPQRVSLVHRGGYTSLKYQDGADCELRRSRP